MIGWFMRTYLHQLVKILHSREKIQKCLTNITSKYFSILNNDPPPSWVAHITRDFLTCYSFSYYSSINYCNCFKTFSFSKNILQPGNLFLNGADIVLSVRSSMDFHCCWVNYISSQEEIQFLQALHFYHISSAQQPCFYW